MLHLPHNQDLNPNRNPNLFLPRQEEVKVSQAKSRLRSESRSSSVELSLPRRLVAPEPWRQRKPKAGLPAVALAKAGQVIPSLFSPFAPVQASWLWVLALCDFAPWRLGVYDSRVNVAGAKSRSCRVGKLSAFSTLCPKDCRRLITPNSLRQRCLQSA